MAAWLGLGSFVVGGYLSFATSDTAALVADLVGGPAQLALAMPGMLALFGTGMLGLALIRMPG
jgi:hypothetical protein